MSDTLREYVTRGICCRVRSFAANKIPADKAGLLFLARPPPCYSSSLQGKETFYRRTLRFGSRSHACTATESLLSRAVARARARPARECTEKRARRERRTEGSARFIYTIPGGGYLPRLWLAASASREALIPPLLASLGIREGSRSYRYLAAAQQAARCLLGAARRFERRASDKSTNDRNFRTWYTPKSTLDHYQRDEKQKKNEKKRKEKKVITPITGKTLVSQAIAKEPNAGSSFFLFLLGARALAKAY